MSSRRKLIEWSPRNSSHFLVAASDLRLYQVPEQQENGLSSKDGIRVLSVNSEIQNIKCLSWAPFKKESDLNNIGEVAVGLLSGRVVLTSLSDGVPRLLKEFVPQHARACNAVSWNSHNNYLLAAGLDKVRNDCSLLIWDVSRGAEPPISTSASSIRKIRGGRGGSIVRSGGEIPTTTPLVKESASFQTGGPQKFSTVPLMETLESIRKPYVELGQSEATQALSWLPSMPSCIAVGTGVKWLRIYDLRQDLNAPKSVVAHSRAVNGVSFDPFHEHRLLTFSDDGVIKLWDIRKLNQPIFTVNSGSKSLLEVKWCPTRSGVLSSIARDDSCMKIWDLKDTSQLVSSDQSPAITFNRPVRTYHTNDPLVSISWHLSNEYRLLSISDSGMVELVQLHESIPITCSVRGAVGWAYGKNLFCSDLLQNSNQADGESPIEDISVVMRRRAEMGYSMDIEYNLSLAKKGILTQDIKRLHEWMRNIEPVSPRFLGILSILKNETHDVVSESVPSTKEVIGKFPPCYRSARRQLVLQVCGWAFDATSTSAALEEGLQRLEERGLYRRAAAIAVFHFQIQRAVQCLHKEAKESGDSRYQFVAMALAGYSGQDEQIESWRATCGAVIDQMDDPYLQSCFNFLCNTNDSFCEILNNRKLRLMDRIAFACCFLPDAEMLECVEAETTRVMNEGDIEGIALTGLSLDGVNLFQNYIDRTADIQTACLAMSRVVPSRFIDSTVTQWVQLYKQLLDSWQLWHKRALLDISMSEGPLSEAKPAQVFARCTFCNTTLELGLVSSKAKDRNRFRAGRSHPVEKIKISGCPSCKKPLPFCSVCQLPLHCVVPRLGQEDNKSKPARKFDEWFTWCQNCKHGGHSNHITEWFLEHAQCPVTDCSCNCNSL